MRISWLFKVPPALPQAFDSGGVAFDRGRSRVGRGRGEVVTVHHRADACGKHIAIPVDQGTEGVAVLRVCARAVGQEGDGLILIRLRREGRVALRADGHEQVAVGLHQDRRDQGRFGRAG